MPLHITPLSRRHFLRTVAAATGGLLTLRHLSADAASGGRLALVSDTHISADPAEMLRGTNMTQNLRRVLDEILARRPAISGVLINGDCAMMTGRAADYAQFTKLLQPVIDARLPIYMTLGNHDDRDAFARQVTVGGQQPIDGRIVTILETPRANWFILDSLHLVNKTPGLIGDAQLHWLSTALDQRTDKPAIVMAHHDPQFNIDLSLTKTGLLDTTALFNALMPRRHVKAFVYGHTHNWKIAKHDDLWLVNLPPTAWLFNNDRPRGWVEASVEADGMSLQLFSLDTKHPEHGQVQRLAWRV
jgi:hypothetical protein